MLCCCRWIRGAGEDGASEGSKTGVDPIAAANSIAANGFEATMARLLGMSGSSRMRKIHSVPGSVRRCASSSLSATGHLHDSLLVLGEGGELFMAV